MNLKVLFFGAAAEAAQLRERDFSASPDATVSELLEILRSEYPPLASLRLVPAVNQEYANQERRLQDGDEVAVFTPVSGG
jgi:molybdopterin synthase sulfur carrier subunit